MKNANETLANSELTLESLSAKIGHKCYVAYDEGVYDYPLGVAYPVYYDVIEYTDIQNWVEMPDGSEVLEAGVREDTVEVFTNYMLYNDKIILQDEIIRETEIAQKNLEQKFENVIHGHETLKYARENGMTLHEYVEANIKANEYFFFTADTDKEVSELNEKFVAYIEENY